METGFAEANGPKSRCRSDAIHKTSKIHNFTSMKKLYYSIGEVSRITGIESHVLRYWESVFPMLRPQKNSAGNRRYREEDLSLIVQLKELIQTKRYSTAGALKVLQGQHAEPEAESDSLPPDLKLDLVELRHFLVELRDRL